MSASQQALDHIQQQVRAAYEMGRASRWQLLLSRQDPAQLARMMTYHEAILRARGEQFHQHQDSIRRLQEVERELQAVMVSLRDKQQELQQQYQRLVQQRRQREQTLSRLHSSQKGKDQQLKQQQQQKKELQRIIDAASRIASGKGFAKDHVPFRQLKGRLPWPVSGKIQYRFGSARQGGGRWEGVLLKASEGAPVRVVHGGRVLFADWLPGQGMLMIVDHGDQYMSLYAHNEVLLKKPGEWVSGGDTIARSGNSGGLSSTALYFEVRHKGSPVDPAAWCK